MRRLLFLLALLSAFAVNAAHATAITDDRDITVSFVQPPQRIVSLLPSLTESVCALGHCSRLVGVDRYSNHPAQVKALPQLGSGIEPNIEGIVRLRPDVVLLASSSRAATRLESLGIRVLALEPKNQADVRRVLNGLELALGQAMGSSAAGLWASMEADMRSAAASMPARARSVSVYFEVGRGPYAAGEASFIGELLLQLGVKNIVPASLGPFPLLNPEFVVRADPNVMMFSSTSDMAAGAYPGWNQLKAMRDKRICRFDERQADVLVRPGPRLGEAARILAACLESATR